MEQLPKVSAIRGALGGSSMEWADVSVKSKARLKGLVIGKLFEKHRALHAVVLINLLKIARKVMQSSRKCLEANQADR